jgi:uncharacterized membrane protein YesL
MASLFRQDSAFMRGLGWLVEVVEINLLVLVTSIPVVTIGAAMTAGYDAARRLRIGEGKTLPNYFRAFKANFAKATILWLILGPIGAAIIALWIFIQMTPLLVVKFALSILWLIAFYWVWPLTARFENTVGATLKNALVIGISKIVPSIGMFAVDAAFCGLVAASWLYMPQGLFLLAIFGVGLLLALHVPIAESGLKQFIPASSAPTPPPEE